MGQVVFFRPGNCRCAGIRATLLTPSLGRHAGDAPESACGRTETVKLSMSSLVARSNRVQDKSGAGSLVGLRISHLFRYRSSLFRNRSWNSARVAKVVGRSGARETHPRAAGIANKSKSADKPGSVTGRACTDPMAVIHRGVALPRRSSHLPADLASSLGLNLFVRLLGVAPDGGCRVSPAPDMA